MIEKQYRKAMLTGGMAGVGVWLAYATVAFILLSVAPLLWRPAAELNASVWRIQAIILGVYVLAGAVLGSVTGLALTIFGAPRASDWKTTRCVVVLLFLVIFCGDLVADGRLPGGEQISLAAAGLGILAGLASLCSQRWHDRVGFLVDPLTASLFVLAPLWTGRMVFGERSWPFRLGILLPVLFAVALVSWWFGKRRRPIPASPIGYLAAMVGLLLIAGGAGWTLSPGSPKLPPRKSTASVRRPNVVLIVMDTVRADHTSLYGYERDTTPFLRELAKGSTVYEHAVAVSDMTLPTHASMFTGLYPQTHGAHYAPPLRPLGQPLAEEFTTMAEVLRANGYRTMAVVANYAYVTPEMGLSQGFEVFDWRAPLGGSYLTRRVASLLGPFLPTLDLELPMRRAGEITDQAKRALDQVDADTPYFLFVNYMDAHVPYIPPEPFRTLYPCSDPSIGGPDGTTRILHEVISRKRTITTNEQQCLESLYDGGIANIDSQLRGLVARLKTRGQWENTLLIVTGDHGESFGRRNQVGHAGMSVYHEEIGIPLLVKYPGNKPAALEAVRASQVDLLPTVLDIANLPLMPGLAGLSLRQIATGGPRALVSVSYPDSVAVSLHPDFRRTEEGLMLGEMKLVLSTTGKRELFDLSKDSYEENNLYRDGDPRAASLMATLETWKRNVRTAKPARMTSGDRGAMDRLKSLGYAQ